MVTSFSAYTFVLLISLTVFIQNSASEDDGVETLARIFRLQKYAKAGSASAEGRVARGVRDEPVGRKARPEKKVIEPEDLWESVVQTTAFKNDAGDCKFSIFKHKENGKYRVMVDYLSNADSFPTLMEMMHTYVNRTQKA